MSSRSNWLNTALLVAEKDIDVFLKGLNSIITLIANYLVTLVFMGFSLAGLLVLPNYFAFFASGLVLVGLFNTSFLYYTIISDERQSGYIRYLLVLPCSKSAVAVGRMAAAVGQGFLLSALSLVPIFVLIGVLPTILGLASVILGILCGGLMLGGLGLFLATRLNSDLVEPLTDFLGISLVFTSNIYYPQTIAPYPLSFVATLNPISWACDTIRYGMGLRPFSLPSTVLAVSSALVLAYLGARSYAFSFKRLD